MRQLLPLLLLFVLYSGVAQDSVLLEFRTYLDQVRKFHPVARQANLLAGMGAARLQESRGGFDPKIEVDYGSKEYQGKTYYDRLNAAFKIPTWYGVEFKGQFEQNEGDYLNPSEVIPSDGLYSAEFLYRWQKGCGQTKEWPPCERLAFLSNKQRQSAICC
jgi:hypothetical protein